MQIVYMNGDWYIAQLGKDEWVCIDTKYEEAWKSQYAETWLRAGYWDSVPGQLPQETIDKIRRIIEKCND